jgi:phosphoglycolate phosphatase-like HAD superfamily hydrolase
MLEPSNSLRAAILDCDDTLIATRASRTDALIVGAAHFGFTITSADIGEHWGKPFNQLISSLMPGIDYDAFLHYYAEIMRNIPPIVLPGVPALLLQLKSSGIRTLLVSSGSRELVVQDLEASNLLQFVDRLWGYEDTVYHKPDPRVLDPILSTIREMSISQDKVLYMGDSIQDFLTASHHRLLFCAVLSGSSTREDFRAIGLDDNLIINSLEDLLAEESWLLRRLGVK